jgi:hypothetical protein
VVLVFPTAKNFVVGPQPSSGVARRWRQGSHAGDAAHLGCRTRKPEMRKITFIDECAFFVDAFEFSGNAAPFLCTHSAVNPPKGVVFVSGPAAQCSVLLKFSGLAAQVGPLTPVALIIFITSARYLGPSRQTRSVSFSPVLRQLVPLQMGSVGPAFRCPWCGRIGNGGYAADWIGYPICTEGDRSCLWHFHMALGFGLSDMRHHQLTVVLLTRRRAVELDPLTPQMQRQRQALSVALPDIARFL